MTDKQWTSVKSALLARLATAKQDLRVELNDLRRDHGLEESFYVDMLRRAREDDPGFAFSVTIHRRFTQDPVQIVCRYEDSAAV